jgi:hypothetical protein
MFTISEPVMLQLINTTINVGMLIAIIKATRSVSRLELKVEMMWKVFSRNVGMADYKD